MLGEIPVCVYETKTVDCKYCAYFSLVPVSGVDTGFPVGGCGSVLCGGGVDL